MLRYGCYTVAATSRIVSKGNPNWTRKYGEPTKVVRLPISLADEILEKLKAEVPVDEILQQAETESSSEIKITIVQAIAQVMKIAGRPLEVLEVYQEIVKNNLYRFKADEPVQVVRGQIRRHCEGLDFSSASPTKHFIITGDGKYWLRDVPLKQQAEIEDRNLEVEELKIYEEDLLKVVRTTYNRYLTNFRNRVLQQIAGIAPNEFESFSRKLLEAFGFQKIKITERHEDGGIKGYGDCELSGIDFLQYAFQVKRSNNVAIQPTDINEFRGSIDGEFRQGMFFTTSEFADKAKEIAGKRGAIPIALVDGSRMVDQMIAQRLGIEKVERIKGVLTYSIVLENITDKTGPIEDK